MTDTQIVQALVGLESELGIFEIEKVKKIGKMVKVIHASNSTKRVRCSYCKKYIRSVHDRLKPIKMLDRFVL